MRARINTLDWWKERSTPLLEKWQNNTPYSWEIYSEAEEALAALDVQAGERMELSPLSEMQTYLRRLPHQKPPVFHRQPRSVWNILCNRKYLQTGLHR